MVGSFVMEHLTKIALVNALAASLAAIEVVDLGLGLATNSTTLNSFPWIVDFSRWHLLLMMVPRAISFFLRFGQSCTNSPLFH